MSDKDLVYREGHGHAKLDVYSPSALAIPGRSIAGRLPAVLAIHGGSWVGGSKSEYGPQVSRLARHGFVVFVADYRLARSGTPGWPEALDDLREAVRWIRMHADGVPGRSRPDRGDGIVGRRAARDAPWGRYPAEQGRRGLVPGPGGRQPVWTFRPCRAAGNAAARRMTRCRSLIKDSSSQASAELLAASPIHRTSPGRLLRCC